MCVRMIDPISISGKIIRGANQGAFFTQLEWVQEQCLKLLGFTPWPGTLNLEISMDRVAAIKELKVKGGLELISPNMNYCSGHVFPVTIEGIPAAIVLPAEDVRVHPSNVIEIISPKRLKDALDVKDGDWVTLFINNPNLARKKM